MATPGINTNASMHSVNIPESLSPLPKIPTAELPQTHALAMTNEVAKTPRSSMTASTSKSKLPFLNQLNDFVSSLGEMVKKAVGSIKSKNPSQVTVNKSQINHEKAETTSPQMRVSDSNRQGISLLIETWDNELIKLRDPSKNKRPLNDTPSSIAKGYEDRITKFLNNVKMPLTGDEMHKIGLRRAQFAEIAQSSKEPASTDTTPAPANSASPATKNETAPTPSSPVKPQNDAVRTALDKDKTAEPPTTRAKLKIQGKSKNITVGRKLGDGDSGIVKKVMIGEKEMAIKHPSPPPESTKLNPNLSKADRAKIEKTKQTERKEAEKRRNERLTSEGKITQEITATEKNVSFNKGLSSPVQVGTIDGKPAMIMELFDSSLEVKTNDPSKRPSPKVFQSMMSDILAGVDHIKNKGYAWVDAKPANIACKDGRYLCFDFGASVKLEDSANTGSPGYNTSTDNVGHQRDINKIQELIDKPDIRKQELEQLKKLCAKDKLNNKEITYLLFYNKALSLGLDDKVLENLKKIPENIHANPLSVTNKKSIQDLNPKVVDNKNFQANVKQIIASYKEEIKELNHKRDVLALGISFYEILFQKVSETSENDHYSFDSQTPRYDIMINDLMDLHAKATDPSQKLHIKTVIAMLDPDWKKRPSVEDVQTYLNDPKSKIETRVNELIQMSTNYKDLNEKYEKDKASVNENDFLNKEMELFGEKLVRNTSNAVSMPLQKLKSNFDQWNKLQQKSDLSDKEKELSTELEKQIFRQVLKRDGSGNISQDHDDLRASILGKLGLPSTQKI